MSSPTLPGQTLAKALDASEPLAGLMQRVQASKARLQVIQRLLPAGLQGEVRSGPLDDAAWVLLVGNAAAAAKLRQCVPTLESALGEHGWAGPPIKIRILPRG